MSIETVPELVREIYAIVAKLEAAFPGRHFTPDGHLVGSLGEVLAAAHYGLELLPASAEAHDARTPDGRKVQVKATQVNRVALRQDCDLLLVLQLDKDGGFKEVYNGPGAPVWEAAGSMQSNGQRAISLTTLRELNSAVADKDRIAPVRELGDAGGASSTAPGSVRGGVGQAET